MMLRVLHFNKFADNPTNVNFKCPLCKQLGTFGWPHSTADVIFVNMNEKGLVRLGPRLCPNEDCRALVVVAVHGNNLIQTYPPLRIDFITTRIPENIVLALDEAITCHANKCYIATAIMIRKTLEIICKEQGISKGNLKERLNHLKSSVTLPNALFEALNHLRLLGNDAAHIEAATYDKVGDDEATLAIDVTKEILKALYQHDDLVSRLKALQKPPII